MNLEKAVNHGEHSEHSEKAGRYVDLQDHPLGSNEERKKFRLFAVCAVSAVVELRLLG
ncbi:MAG: hypothetical protein QM739_17605 [Propionivibrio sp.]